MMSMDGFSGCMSNCGRVPFLISFVTVILCGATLGAQDNQFTVDPLFIAGGRGSSPGDFGIPESVILDARGQIAVTDKGRMMVHVYSRHNGEVLFSLGGLGSDPGEFNRPNGIAVDSQGRILVVEQRNQRVQIFDADYQPIGEFGFLGGADGGFQKPMGITVDSQDQIYVTDESRADVQVFDRDGNFLWKFADSSPRLRQVESIEVDERSQRIFVCDESRSTVNLYDMQGNFLSSFGEQGSGLGQFGNDPNAIRIDSKQRIWVNDQGNTRINVYAPDTSFLASFYNSANGMESADGMELSEEHNLLLVADQGNDRVLAFDLMAMQALLEMVEQPTAASSLQVLTAHSGNDYSGMRHPLWEQTKLFLAANGSGNPERIDVAIVRVASDSDARGILVQLTETGPNTGIFHGEVQLAESSDPTRAQLAATPGEVVRAHLAGSAWEIAQPVDPLPAPEVHGMSAGPGTLLDLHRDPHLRWTFHDPAGLRGQDAFEVSVFQEDSLPVWSSGERLTSDASFVLEEHALPAAARRRVELRVRSGDLWSAPQSLVVRRNTPPPLAALSEPADDSILQDWPPRLRALPGGNDADGQPVQLRFETRSPNGKLWKSRFYDILERDWLECAGDFNVMENQTLLWRITTFDGVETNPGPWQRLHRNEIEEAPSMPTILSPRENAPGYEDELFFSWSTPIDPDPQQQAQVFFEWHTPTGVWQRQPAEGLSSHRWPGTAADESILWRISVEDPSGHRLLTIPRSLELHRNWTAELRAVGDRRQSQPLQLGTRPGAQDGFVQGEDALAPIEPGQLRVTSIAPLSTHGKPGYDGDRLVDIRRPRSPGTDKQHSSFEILVRGLANELVDLQINRLELPTSWSLLWQDSDEHERIELTPDKASRLRLDHQGEARGSIRVVFSSEISERNRPSDPRGSGRTLEADSPGGIAQESKTRFSLQRHLSQLPNPLTARIHLLPTDLNSTVEIQIFDARGRRVHRWSGNTPALRASEVFGRSDLPSGVYLLRMRTLTQSAHRKMLWQR